MSESDQLTPHRRGHVLGFTRSPVDTDVPRATEIVFLFLVRLDLKLLCAHCSGSSKGTELRGASIPTGACYGLPVT